MDPIGKKLLDIAEKELGYTEKSSGYTKYGDWWTKNVDADNDDYFKTAPWCDMFLAWAADKADVTEQAGQFASTVEHAKWFEKNDAWGTEPEPGAIVFYDWNGSDDIDQIDHVGIVEKVDGKTLRTIEGNADGYKLMRKTRSMDTVVGFGYPSKVKVAETTYTPRHAVPAPTVDQVGERTGATHGHEQEHAASAGQLPAQDVVLGGILAFVLCGTVALAAGRTAAAKAPASAPIRVRKRGKHHRRPAPVALPADVTPADLDRADAGTTVMPALSLAAAQEAEDREFWGRIAHLEEDTELAFWDSLHADVTDDTADQYATTPGFS